jgi:signal transduction histidine kinase
MRQDAHDLASLLTVSNGYRSEAERALATVLSHLAKAQIADQRAIELVRSMLAGKPKSSAPGVFDITDVIGDLMALFAGQGGAVLEWDHPVNGSLPMTGEGLALFRALLNLCVNAREAGAATIRIKTGRVREGMALLTLSDNGCGMLPEKVAMIWDQPLSGDGLHGHGLAIVKRTIEQHGGTVTVASKAEMGTVFTIYLPLAATPAAETHEDAGTVAA